MLKAERRNIPIDIKQGQTLFVRNSEATADISVPRLKSVLDRGHDWKFRVDLDRKLLFSNFVETKIRPDLVLVSQQSKMMDEIELNFSWEENCEEAHERKSLKYADLMAVCKDKVWSVWLFPMEIGCKESPAQSVWKLLA